MHVSAPGCSSAVSDKAWKLQQFTAGADLNGCAVGHVTPPHSTTSITSPHLTPHCTPLTHLTPRISHHTAHHTPRITLRQTLSASYADSIFMFFFFPRLWPLRKNDTTNRESGRLHGKGFVVVFAVPRTRRTAHQTLHKTITCQVRRTKVVFVLSGLCFCAVKLEPLRRQVMALCPATRRGALQSYLVVWNGCLFCAHRQWRMSAVESLTPFGPSWLLEPTRWKNAVPLTTIASPSFKMKCDGCVTENVTEHPSEPDCER